MSDYAIGFISGFEVSTPFMASVINAVARDRCGVVSVLGGPLVHRNRNELSAMFLRGEGGDVTRMLMVDSDIVFEMEHVDAILAHDEPLVSGIYMSQDGRTVTDGCGFLLINRRVLEAIGEFPFNPMKLKDGRVTGEDVGFRQHALKAGFPCVVDHSIAVGHLKAQILRVEAKQPNLVTV